MPSKSVEQPQSALVKSGEPPAGAVTVPTTGDASIVALLHEAVKQGTKVDELKELVALHERLADRDAAREFAKALAAFQAECPPISKVKTAKIATRSGTGYEYTYAPLQEIVRVIKPLLIVHGFSYGWDSDVTGGSLKVTCTLRHENGHSTSASFTLPIENSSAMSPQQKVGAALTFAQRKTLESVLGLNTADEDTDAAETDPTPVTDDQATELLDLMAEAGGNLPRFLKHFEIERVADLPRVRYAEAKAAIQQRKERRAAQ